MKTNLTFFLILFLAFVSAQELAFIGKDKKFGFMDTSGKVVIPLQYKNVVEFSDGLALVEVKGKWGFIDPSGTMVIEPQFKHAKSFNSGVAIVEKNNQWIYIDKTGKELTHFPPTDKKYDFEDGVAFFQQNKLIGVIDNKGNIILEPKYKEIKSFKNGYAKFLENEKYGILSIEGKIIIPAEYDAIDVSDNKVLIGKKGEKIGIIDPDNSFHTVEGATKIWQFFGENGTLTYAKKGEKIGFIDAKGNWVIEPVFDKARAFNQGLAPVNIDGKWGFINTKGEMVIPAQFRDAEIFCNEGLAPVVLDKLYGFIDKTGNLVIKDEYVINYGTISLFQGGDQKGFINGLARISKKKKWAFLNTSGQLVGDWYDQVGLFRSTK